ncbi:histidine kinase N-terminal 7TM domain-containing protein [Halobacterium jilantaiense]|uniref:histidine kinase n=1 Tax=Halobacterium jilantaiense TaxID=355548 RepID=A0A1I0PMD7_9EURY|nr:histidine kinase N-terminal 7TM domain-containing protein [Halobacterium jilantaiense]SEW15509.1 PAS domain-containing protein [Halobacterium jilantaiense]
MQVTPGVVLTAISAAVSLGVAGYAVRRPAPGARAVAAFSAAIGVWTGASVLQSFATTLDGKLLADQLKYVGIAVIPVAWVSFAAAYSGREHWVTKRTIAALSVVPVAVLVLVATNDHHGLVLADAGLETVGGRVVLDREYGAAFWILTAYTNAVNSVGTVLLIEAAVRVGRRYRRQAFVVLAGATVPWLFTVTALAGVAPIEPEASFGVASLAFAYAISRYGLVELEPVARDRLFDELDDGVLVADDAGRIVDHNPAAERLLGASLSAGDDLRTAVPDAVAEALDADAAEPAAVDGADGTRWLTVQATPVSENRAGDVVVVRDVTELERRRTDLRRENARLERVSDTISHDLRNPLNVASGSIELAAETGSEEDFDRVRDALDRMDDIIESTLRVARSGREDPDETAVSLSAVAERAWQNVPTGDASVDICEDARVRADPDQLESLLENLFRNAVEHGSTSPDSQARQDAVEHGSTGNRTAQQSDDAVEHGAEDSAVTVTVDRTSHGFFVADDGVGLPESERGAVFQRGVTTSDDGTGLGLAIVEDIADTHGWQVTLGESDSGGVRVDVAGVTAADDERDDHATAAGHAGSETARGTD